MSSSDEQRQALSAFIDSEADDLEVRRTAAALLNDADLQASWRRFHVIGALLRGEVTQPDTLRSAGSAAATLRLRDALALEAPLSTEAPLSNEVAHAQETQASKRPSAARAGAGSEHSSTSQRQATQQRANGRRWYVAGLGLATAAGLSAGMWLGAPGGSIPGGLLQPSSATSGQLADAPGPTTVAGAPTQVAFAAHTFDSQQPQRQQPQRQQTQAQRRARLYMLIHAQQAGLSQASQGISLVKFVSYRQPSNGSSNDSALHNTEQ